MPNDKKAFPDFLAQSPRGPGNSLSCFKAKRISSEKPLTMWAWSDYRPTLTDCTFFPLYPCQFPTPLPPIVSACQISDCKLPGAGRTYSVVFSVQQQAHWWHRINKPTITYRIGVCQKLSWATFNHQGKQCSASSTTGWVNHRAAICPRREFKQRFLSSIRGQLLIFKWHVYKARRTPVIALNCFPRKSEAGKRPGTQSWDLSYDLLGSLDSISLFSEEVNLFSFSTLKKVPLSDTN